jgi:hypothetical protein
LTNEISIRFGENGFGDDCEWPHLTTAPLRKFENVQYLRQPSPVNASGIFWNNSMDGQPSSDDAAHDVDPMDFEASLRRDRRISTMRLERATE